MSEIAASLFESVLFPVFLTFFLEPKRGRGRVLFGIFITAVLLFLNIYISDMYGFYNVYALLADLAVTAVFWRLFLKGTLINYLTGFALYYFGLYFSVYFSTFLFSFAKPGTVLAAQLLGTGYRVGFLVLTKALLLIYTVIMMHFRKHFRCRKGGFSTLCYSAFPVIVFLFFVLLTNSFTGLCKIEPTLGAKMVGAMAGIHFIVIAAIYLSFHAVARAEEEYDVRRLNYMLALQRESLEKFISQERELYQLRHELEHKLFTIQYLLGKNRMEEGLRVMGQMIEELCGDARDISVSQNIVDTVIANIERKHEKAGVRIEKEILISDDTVMDMVDLCILLGNLLDNAMEAAAESAEKRVGVSVREELGCLLIRVSNTFSEENSDVKSFISPKEETGKHGFGMRHIRETVRRYGGEITTHDEGDWFYSDVIIYDKN
ncbi:MAG: GHKL domain-containing protein [Lachnospiraceae bacterium]|nr:GHKL domain-containing protein [Lachnospiraceae bacterium]